tara:strand:- start:372 stop:593 length:222 start_codon:yes stop_codon:yes gene_type:complete
MKRKIKNKKTYKMLIDEIKVLENIILYYKDQFESFYFVLESYIRMNNDEEKLVKYLKERGDKREDETSKESRI